MFRDPYSRLAPRHSPRPRRRFSRAEYAFVLGGLVLAAAATAAALILGAGLQLIGPLWTAAIAWAVPAQIVHALWRGFRRKDWSGFGRYEPPVDNDTFDWGTKTGKYAYLRIHEEYQRLMGDES